jgi:hypothetical protein
MFLRRLAQRAKRCSFCERPVKHQCKSIYESFDCGHAPGDAA